MNEVPTEETETFESLDRVLQNLEDPFMGAYLAHQSASTMEEIWEARGIARVMDRLRELYLLTYGVAYVPRSFRQN